VTTGIQDRDAAHGSGSNDISKALERLLRLNFREFMPVLLKLDIKNIETPC